MRMICAGYYSVLLRLSFFLSQYATTLTKASSSPRNASRTDLSRCKLTQFGTEYAGSVMATAGGIRCQMWHSDKPLHKVSESITDTDFPERSLHLARNYCRNPTKDPKGPWCYTMEPTLIDDECEVPLCNFGECRISGTGSEYGGTHDTASSGKKCKSWDKKLKLAVNKTEKFPNNHFSDLSRDKAKNFCRNPDSTTGGPWCYVDSDDYDMVEKEYCSVPFCDDKDCLVYSKNASAYSILTSLNSTIGNITFWIKLWNPADEEIGQARLLFTHLKIPTRAEVIAQEWRAGVEIVISNSGSGQEYPTTDDEKDFEETPSILVGSKWTALWVSWGGGFISVGHHGSMKPIFLGEFKKKNSISSMYPESFFQYGIMGTGVLWSMEFCEDTCEVHTTLGIDFLRVWPLVQTNSSHDILFHVRASHKATIQLTQTPAVPFPCLTIVIGQSGATLIMYQEKQTSTKEILLDLQTKHILNFWAWTEFTISIFGVEIQLFWHRDYGREKVFSIEHNVVHTLRWFSIGSENTIAHWTLFCAPTEADAVEAPWFPNCVSSSSDTRYEGSQWTAENEVPCIPWISNKIPEDSKKDDNFIDGSALKALNKCRNPTKDPGGPFCYTAIHSEGSSVKKEYCPIRKCRSSECRMAGTANDYLGTLSVTRSGRTCAPWLSEDNGGTAPKKKTSFQSLIARAIMSLRMNRENALKESVHEIPKERWNEISLRSRLRRGFESAFTQRTPRPRRITESQNPDGSHKLMTYGGPTVKPGTRTSTTTGAAQDDEDFDLFNLKPATFGDKKTLKASSKKTRDVPSHSPGDDDYPGVFRPYQKPTTPDSSGDDDDDFDFLNVKPATFGDKKTSKATSKKPKDVTSHSPGDNDLPGVFRPYQEPTTPDSSGDDDDDFDFLNLKPATFGDKKTSKATSTKPKDVTSHSPGDDDLPGVFRPYQEPTTRDSFGDDDDDFDFLNMKPATFGDKKTSKATSKKPKDATSHSPGDDDLPGVFRPYQEPTTPDSASNDDLFDSNPATFRPHQVPTTTTVAAETLALSTVGSSTPLPQTSDTHKTTESDTFSDTTPEPQLTDSKADTSTKKQNPPKSVHKVDPRYLNDTLYPEQSVRNASNFCRNPSRNIAGTWCYTTDPEVPQDLCNVRDCEQPEECIFLVRGKGMGRRLYVLPEYRSEGLHFSLKEWEPDRPDSITFVILSEDDVQSRYILKVGAMNNEKVLLYYETKENGINLVKQKTLPHLLYLGRWTGFVLRMDRGIIHLSYEGAPYPLFEWNDPDPASAFLPVYYYYSSENSNTIGVAFNCDTNCHIEQTTTYRFSRILPISIWEKEETPSPHRLVLMLRGEGVILVPLLMLPTTPGYYALTIGEKGQWVYFVKNKHPVVQIFHKQDANGPLFNADTWTNVTIEFNNYTIQVLRNGTEVFRYVHILPLLFYLFSLSVDTGGWVTWAVNCIPTDIDGDPLDGGWSEWGPWSCSASCNGGMGVRKRTCNNPEPNIKGQPCLGPSTSNGHCNMNKCGDVTDVTVALIKRRIRTQHTSIVVSEGNSVTLSADEEIVYAVRNETPTSQINWSRNGIFLEEEEDRVEMEDTAVSITAAVVNDSGVYTQTLHREDDSHLIFKIITLAVVPKESELVIRETLSFSLICHCVVLGYAYSDLKVAWMLNGKVFKDYGVSTPIAVNVDHIPKVNRSHDGEWRCEVQQTDLNFKWTTNVIKVRVLGPPNWRTYLMEDKLTSPIFGWMPSEGFVAFSAFFLTILIVVIIVASTTWYIRFRESLKYKDPQTEKLINTDDDSESEELIDKKKRSK